MAKTSPRKSRSTRSRSWHSKFFRALDLTNSPFKVTALFLAIGVVGYLVYAHAATSYAAYLAPQTYTTCANQPCWCPGQSIVDINRKADMEYSLRCMINYARKVKGLSQLNLGGDIDNSAIDKNRDIVACNQFSHTACDRAMTYWFFADGYLPGSSFWLAGENLAWGMGTVASPRATMNMWLNSSQHRANIFTGKFNDQGLSVRFSSSLLDHKNVYTWVSHFGCHDGTSCQ